MPCTDDNFQLVYNSFQSVRHPFILTPGDNDWTDCHFLKSPTFDPIERLAKVRTMFFPEGRSLGQRTIDVESQAKDPQYRKFVENLRWSFGGVTFVTVHIVGSNDNFGRTPEMDYEHRERKAANLAWIHSGFAAAKADGSHGIVLLTKPIRDLRIIGRPPRRHDTYAQFLARNCRINSSQPHSRTTSTRSRTS